MPDATPNRPGTDSNLLFGILALQMDFITRDALIAAMHAWVLDKAKPLRQILVELGALQPAKRDLLEPLVAAHLEMHGGDVEKSLAAIPVAPPLREQLRSLAGLEVQAALAQLPTPSDQDASLATRATTAEQPYAGGLRYHVLRPHGKGGLGEVFIAHDQELNRQVALKEIQDRHADDPQSRGRFVREAEITGGLEHPGIVPVYGLGQYADGRPYYAMRLIQGETLKDAIARYHKPADTHRPADAARSKELELRSLLTRFVVVCNAIAYAHSRGVIHRDIKPSNIMLGKYGETLVVDWGLAKALPNSPALRAGDRADEPMLVPRSYNGIAETHLGAALGTPAYMSPEQAAGRVDELGPASDIYSLGATLYTLLAGRPAVDSNDVAEALSRVQRSDWPSPRQVNRAVPPALDAVCRKAMALRACDRYATALELAADVECWLADEPVSAYPEPRVTRARRWTRRHRALMAGATAAVLVAAVGLVIGLFVNSAMERREAAARQKEILARLSEAGGNERLGLMERERGHKGSALVWFQQAQRTLRGLTLDDQAQQERLARISYNLATLFRETAKFEEAGAEYQNAIQAYETLTAETPDNAEYLNDLANAHSGHAIMLHETGRRAQVFAAYDEAFRVQEQAIALAPKVPRYRLSLAGLHNDRALIHEQADTLPAMHEDLQAALRITEEARDQVAGQSSPELEQTVRRHLAMAHLNLGNCYVRQGQLQRGAEEFHVAADTAARLREETPGVSDLDMLAAKSWLNEGLAHLRLIKPESARQPLTQAREILLALRTRLPGDAEVQIAFATCQINLGQLTLQRLLGGEVPKASRLEVMKQLGEQLNEADQIMAVQAKSRKESAQVALTRGSVYFGLAALSRENEQWPATVDWCDKALAQFRPLAQRTPTSSELTLKLTAGLAMRADALFRLGRYAEALEAMDQIPKSNFNPVGFGLMRAGIQARSGAHAEGTAAVERLLAGRKKPLPNSWTYDAGCAYALAIEGLMRDPAPSPAQREELTRTYVSRAVDYLRQAVQGGYKKLDKIRDAGPDGDSDLAALRPRQEFRQFLKELPGAKVASFVYVALAAEKRIGIYEEDTDQGTLTPRGDVKLDEGEPGALTVDPKRQFLFASIRSTGKLAAFRIDRGSGKLTLLNTVAAGPDPAHVAVDATGRFLFAAYYVAGKVTVHAIGADGRLSDMPVQSIATADKAHAIVPDPSNRFVFVPHTGANAIFQFKFDATTGRLTANNPAKPETPKNTGPRHLVFHPTKPVAYVANEQGGSVTAYAFDTNIGTLKPLQTLSTLPQDFQGTNACAEIKLHPNGRSLYVSNRGHDSIAVFTLDDDGKMTAKGQTSTEKTPRSFDLDPSGQFLYAAGESSGKLATYQIDAKTGALKPAKTMDIGKTPWWVLAVEMRKE
jgi:serine/threonine-protein kinase